MKCYSSVYRRRSIRLKGFPYTLNATYFVTICAYKRTCLFGKIIDHRMQLNNFGLIVQNEWIKSEQLRLEVKIDQYVIMPNHFHAIVIFDNKKTKQLISDASVPSKLNQKSLGSLIAGFKSAVTKRINQDRGINVPVWQRNYHDHIIRNEKSLNLLREYIISNPQTWRKDSLFCE